MREQLDTNVVEELLQKEIINKYEAAELRGPQGEAYLVALLELGRITLVEAFRLRGDSEETAIKNVDFHNQTDRILAQQERERRHRNEG